MICPNCGREIPDGTVCPCMLENQPLQPALSDNPAVNALKTVGSSPMSLALAILFSASALLSILSAAATSDTLSTMLYYFSSIGIDTSTLYMVMDSVRSTAVLRAILGSVPAILTATAAWIHYCTCRSTASGNISTAGLTIFKVLRYISMISLCLCALLVVGVMVLLRRLLKTISWLLRRRLGRHRAGIAWVHSHRPHRLYRRKAHRVHRPAVLVQQQGH